MAIPKDLDLPINSLDSQKRKQLIEMSDNQIGEWFKKYAWPILLASDLYSLRPARSTPIPRSEFDLIKKAYGKALGKYSLEVGLSEKPELLAIFDVLDEMFPSDHVLIAQTVIEECLSATSNLIWYYQSLGIDEEVERWHKLDRELSSALASDDGDEEYEEDVD